MDAVRELEADNDLAERLGKARKSKGLGFRVCLLLLILFVSSSGILFFPHLSSILFHLLQVGQVLQLPLRRALPDRATSGKSQWLSV